MAGEEIYLPGRIEFVRSVRELLREIRDRPALWLTAKTLTGLKCLLWGYELACARHDIPEAEQLPDDIPWRGFSEWLGKRYGNSTWSADWHWLLVQHTKSQEEAFDRFFELLDEFEATPREGGAQDSVLHRPGNM